MHILKVKHIEYLFVLAPVQDSATPLSMKQHGGGGGTSVQQQPRQRGRPAGSKNKDTTSSSSSSSAASGANSKTPKQPQIPTSPSKKNKLPIYHNAHKFQQARQMAQQPPLLLPQTVLPQTPPASVVPTTIMQTLGSLVARLELVFISCISGYKYGNSAWMKIDLPAWQRVNLFAETCQIKKVTQGMCHSYLSHS